MVAEIVGGFVTFAIIVVVIFHFSSFPYIIEQSLCKKRKENAPCLEKKQNKN